MPQHALPLPMCTAPTGQPLTIDVLALPTWSNSANGDRPGRIFLCSQCMLPGTLGVPRVLEGLTCCPSSAKRVSPHLPQGAPLSLSPYHLSRAPENG